MCMNKSQPSTSYSTSTPAIVKIEPYPISSSESSRTSFDDNETIAFGPIRVKPRKKPAPTLATGRRSKYEILSPDEEQKRDVRRARNRAAAERVRLSRLGVEQQLLDQIELLEKQEEKLLRDVQSLQHKKLHLETRVFTHEKMCSNVPVSNSTVISEIDLTSYFPSETIPTVFEQFETTFNNKISEIDFDSFINLLTTEQIQQNFPESILNLQLSDDFNDLLMDS